MKMYFKSLRRSCSNRFDSESQYFQVDDQVNMTKVYPQKHTQLTEKNTVTCKI